VSRRSDVFNLPHIPRRSNTENRRLLSSELLVECGGHLSIVRGDAASVVRDEGELYFVVVDLDIRVVTGGFSLDGDLVDELHGLLEIGKRIVADELAVVGVPVDVFFKDVLKRGAGQLFHSGYDAPSRHLRQTPGVSGNSCRESLSGRELSAS